MSAESVKEKALFTIPDIWSMIKGNGLDRERSCNTSVSRDMQ